MIINNRKMFYKRWIFGYIPFSSLMLLIALSGLIATVYTLKYNSSLALDRWSCEGRVSVASEWDNSLHKLTLAQKLNPWDADVYMKLGDLYEWKIAGSLSLNDETKAIRNQAIKYYEESLKLRPTWGLAWLNLSRNKILNREITAETFNAIEMGFKYGRWQPEISKKLISMTVGIWKAVPDNIRNIVRKQVETQIKNKAPISTFAVLALRYNWFEELLSLDIEDKHKDYLNLVKSNPKLLKGAARNSLGNKKKDLVC